MNFWIYYYLNLFAVALQKSNTCCTCFVASSERQSNFGRNGISISCGGAASGVEQLWSDDRNMGKCYSKKELTVTAKLYIIDLLGINCCYSNAFKQEGLFTLSHVKYDLNWINIGWENDRMSTFLGRFKSFKIQCI